MCTWKADGETASDDIVAEYGDCRRLGSGRDTVIGLYSAIGFEVCTVGTTGATVADGIACDQVDDGLNTVDIART